MVPSPKKCILKCQYILIPTPFMSLYDIWSKNLLNFFISWWQIIIESETLNQIVKENWRNIILAIHNLNWNGKTKMFNGESKKYFGIDLCGGIETIQKKPSSVSAFEAEPLLEKHKSPDTDWEPIVGYYMDACHTGVVQIDRKAVQFGQVVAVGNLLSSNTFFRWTFNQLSLRFQIQKKTR